MSRDYRRTTIIAVSRHPLYERFSLPLEPRPVSVAACRHTLNQHKYLADCGHLPASSVSTKEYRHFSRLQLCSNVETPLLPHWNGIFDRKDSIIRAVAAMPCVLLIEDDAAVRDATRMLLNSEGYEVATADCLDEALRQVAQRPGIELLVADYHLGNGKTGLDAIAAIRLQAARDVKAVLITGDISPAVRELGRDGRLLIADKPMHARDFLLLLREFTAR